MYMDDSPTLMSLSPVRLKIKKRRCLVGGSMKFLVSADWHLRDGRPRSRVDNWFDTQRTRLQWVVDQINKYECCMLVAGDIFNASTNTQQLENLILEELSKANHDILTIPGNHEMLYHNIKNLHKSSYYVLHQAHVINHLDGISTFGESTISGFSFNSDMVDGTGIALCHRSVYESTAQIPPFMPNAIGADALLDMYNYDVIISGDIHQSFVVKRDNKVLINPGALFRQSADKKYETPKIYLYDDGVVIALDIPIVLDNVVHEYLAEDRERNLRIDAFVELVKVSSDMGLSFEDNIEKSLKTAELSDNARELVLKAMAGGL